MITDARRLAFEVLMDVEEKGEYSNLLLPRRLRESGLSSQDRAFATQLVYGTLRMRGRLDFFISNLSDRSLSSIDSKVLCVLRLGVFQLINLDTPHHAAVNESTDLAKKVSGKSTGGFVNAILRNLVRNLPELEERLRQTDISTRYSHPQWIVDSYKDLLGDEAEELMVANNQPPVPTLIAWPGRSTREELMESGAIPLPQSNVALTYDGNPGEIAAVRERRAGVQDLGSQFVVEKFYETGHGQRLRWLDLCAGPGGKAAYLDSLITDGDLVANEVSKERAELVKQVVRKGRVISEDGRSLPGSLEPFDRILIDAPCSGIGALRRRPEVRWRRTPADLPGLRTLQQELLVSADKLLTPGGIIGYATCSPHISETVLQVNEFLRKFPNYTRMKIDHQSANKYGDIQLWTHRDGTDAMFLSLLIKSKD